MFLIYDLSFRAIFQSILSDSLYRAIRMVVIVIPPQDRMVEAWRLVGDVPFVPGITRRTNSCPIAAGCVMSITDTITCQYCIQFGSLSHNIYHNYHESWGNDFIFLTISE